ncbi:hypothetical protein BVC80_9063g82 [Macleaya cordata]|uniref:Thionin-like protein n=1 Tax=Macleaya cordata TaxID=56857 RepID=A0A200PNC7_MACCD|nr:hypothetical protein BVC80_9063g82 [Macleaya cordata]
MESKRSVKPIAMMLIVTVLVLGMFVEQTTSISFRICYEQCMRTCSSSKTIRECSEECVGECHDAAATANDLHYYCRVGANEVEGCVNSCSNKCTKLY